MAAAKRKGCPHGHDQCIARIVVRHPLPRLLNTERLIVHISGQNKKKVLDQANAGNNVEELPIRAILQQTQVSATVFWAI